jgi:hypothetical protein
VDDAQSTSPISPESVVVELPLCHHTESGTTFGLSYSPLREMEAPPKVKIPIDRSRFIVSLNSQKHISTRTVEKYSLSVFKWYFIYSLHDAFLRARNEAGL